MALINCPECNKQISDKAEICVGCGAPVEKPRLLKIGNLEIAPNDFQNRMNLQDAKKACKYLGSGWRLPSKDELNTLYENKDAIGGFANKYYWSSTEFGLNDAWVQLFSNGYQDGLSKNDTGYVRAVRSF
jgi:hypothetical protein